MGANPKARWTTHGPNCPIGRTFGEILEWHLLYWGTGNNGSGQKQKGKPWKLKNFCAEIHGKTLTTASEDEAYGQKLRDWRYDTWPPENKIVLGNILRVLFDKNTHLEEWKEDLERAWKDAKKAKAGSLTASSDPLPGFRSGLGHLGADAREGVAAVANALGEHFYGRDCDLALIDDFVGSRMVNGNKGLLLITAPAGFGKSSLALEWCRRTEKIPGRHTASHYCSILSGSSTTALHKIFANLRRQMAQVHGDRFDAIKSDEDAVVEMLAASPPDDEQLVVWLDGIDEADQLMPCFLPQRLGERVCVIITARAEDNVTPAYLDEWQESLRAKPYNAIRHTLAKLAVDDVARMLAGLFVAARLPAPREQLAGRIYNASEQGYPLFARLMSDDAVIAAKESKKLDLGKKPESLAGYADLQLKRLEGLGATWRDYQPLFAFLTIAREPVRIDELPDLIGQSIVISAIPAQIFRWFRLEQIGGSHPYALLSMAHLKLAEAFRKALDWQSVEAERTFCKRIAKTDFMDCTHYALRQYPWHLASAERLKSSSRILMNLDFISARFSILGSEKSPKMMVLDLIEFSLLMGLSSCDSEFKRHLVFWNKHCKTLEERAREGFPDAWRQLVDDECLI